MAPTVEPTITATDGLLSELLSIEESIFEDLHIQLQILYRNLPVVTQLKASPLLLHFTAVPSSFTSSHTCSPLPLTLKPLEQFSEQLEP